MTFFFLARFDTRLGESAASEISRQVKDYAKIFVSLKLWLFFMTAAPCGKTLGDDIHALFVVNEAVSHSNYRSGLRRRKRHDVLIHAEEAKGL